MTGTDKLHEECGIFGIYRFGGTGVVAECYHGLYMLQHRGQESCGMAVNSSGVISCHKDLGLVNEVFTAEKLRRIEDGEIAIAHCRYSTVGSLSRSNAQPLLVNHLKGAMALCHNGSLTNAALLRRQYEMQGAIFHATSDSEVIAYTITQQRLRTGSIEEAARATMNIIEGAYSLVVMSAKKLIAIRDPHGFRPLCMGRIGQDVVFASESCALDAVGATFERDILPGEMVVVSEKGVKNYPPLYSENKGLCVFEYIYFARPDSVIDGVSVHEARLRAGALLARRCPVEADVVIGAPDSGLDAALGYSRESGIPYGIGLIKNKYIGRTFIQPVQSQRRDTVKLKLNAVSATVRDKRVVMVDDSIVRGTTSARVIKILRDAGAKEVHMMFSSPPFRHACWFGTDIDNEDVLIANHHSEEEIGRVIGADSIGFLHVEDLKQLLGDKDFPICDGCFTGRYPVQPPQQQEKYKFEIPFSKKEQ